MSDRPKPSALEAGAARRKKRQNKEKKRKQEEARKALSARRAKRAEDGLVRMRIPIGLWDIEALKALCDHHGITLSDGMVNLLAPHLDAGGRLTVPDDIGAVCESKSSELDVWLPAETAYQLRHKDGLRPGEIIEILIGHLLEPEWDPRHEEVIGYLPDLDDPSPVACLSAEQNAQRRAYRRELIKQFGERHLSADDGWDPMDAIDVARCRAIEKIEEAQSDHLWDEYDAYGSTARIKEGHRQAAYRPRHGR